jgi:hypothetical protein
MHDRLHMQTSTELEALARTMLAHHVSITPHNLADRAQVDWQAARQLLLDLVKKGHATALKFGRFGAINSIASARFDLQQGGSCYRRLGTRRRSG